MDKISKINHSDKNKDNGNIYSISEVCAEIANEFERLEGKKQVFEYLIDMSKKYPDSLSSDVADKDEKFLVKGCISKAWLVPVYKDGVINFSFDSEAIIVKSVLVLLMRVYNNRSPEEILSVGNDFWQKIGISSIMSMNRRNGMANMLKQIYLYAATFKALNS